MGFKNYKTEPKEAVQELTSEQKVEITNKFAEGKSALAIKHEMFEQFPAGKSFHYLIHNAVEKMKAIETKVQKLMKGKLVKTPATDNKDVVYYAKPTTLTGLKSKMVELYPECDVTALENLVDKIVSSTGNWTEFKEALK